MLYWMQPEQNGEKMPNLKTAAASINKLDELAGNNSVIHKLHPNVKLLVTFVYLVAVISFDRYAVGPLLPYMVYIAVMMALADIPYKLLFSRAVIALPFSLFAGISNIIFDRTGAFLFDGLTVTYGMISFVSIMLKTLLCVSAVLILIATTSMTEISYQLNRMKIPAILVIQLTMTFRYISVLLEEAGIMYTAYLLRSPNEKGIRMKDMGAFAGQLLIRSIDRAERIYFAMKCRGFNGVYHFSTAKKASAKDYAAAAIVVGVLVLMRVYNISLLLGAIV